MKFQVGDRVRVYDWRIPAGATAAIAGIHEDGVTYRLVEGDFLWVSYEEKVYKVHPKQLRKLVKRERRRVWILEADLNDPIRPPKAIRQSPLSTGEWKPEDYIEFIEVRRKT